MFNAVTISSRAKADALLVGVFRAASGPARLDDAANKLPEAEAIAEARRRPECTGKLGDLAEAHTGGRSSTRVVLVGLGEKDALDMERLRKAATSALKRLAKVKAGAARVEIAGAIESAGLDPEAAGVAVGEIAALLSYDADRYKGAETRKDLDRPKLSLRSDSKPLERGLRRGLAIGRGANVAREASDAPPNIANPKWMASQARALARKHEEISVRVISGAALDKEKLVGIKTVGQASINPPCLIRIEYRPKNAARNAKPIVLVGKTITYDTGGLSLKIQGSMAGMKHDMGGGAATLGAMHIIASVVKPKRPVVALLAAAENCVSDNAYRPDDVLTFRNGKTVEVTNTDAEGRLVLADALCWATDKEKPQAIVDMATLTGGVVVALGSTYAGVWCDDDALRERVETAASETGERVWRLPLHPEYTEMMKSHIADVVNSNPNRKAHPIQGAAFLQQFVGEDIPWCHIDIAGVSDVESATGPYVKGATGFGARLVAKLVENWR
jgi:leucyl aminopeptidase